MKTKYLLLIIITAILLAGCAVKVNVDACITEAHIYGFWGGLWHGIIAPIDLVAMIFSDKYTVYAQNNNGAWYAFGFIIGSGGWGFLGSKGARKKQ